MSPELERRLMEVERELTEKERERMIDENPYYQGFCRFLHWITANLPQEYREKTRMQLDTLFKVVVDHHDKTVEESTETLIKALASISLREQLLDEFYPSWRQFMADLERMPKVDENQEVSPNEGEITPLSSEERHFLGL